MDLASSYHPFAFPLKSITAEETAEKLLLLIADFGIPSGILTDKVSNFLSHVFRQLTDKLGIIAIRTSPYHPPNQWAVRTFPWDTKVCPEKKCCG